MTLLFEVSNGIATITLNRPQAMNSIDPDMRRALHEAWANVRDDDAIRVAILTGAGERAFCTGSDLKKTMPPQESHAQLTFGSSRSDHLLAGLDTDKPLLCAVNGYAVGGGLELALACDVRIASETAKFGLTEAAVGSIPGGGGTQTLQRVVGQAVAMRMLLTGEIIDAGEALRVGLVSEVCEPAALLTRANEIATRIAASAPLSVRAIKRLVRQGADLPLSAAMEMERHSWGLLRDTEDRIEGRRAFAEKRPPQFRGR